MNEYRKTTLMSRSQQLNLENAKIKVRNFSHKQTHNDILFN